MKTRRWLITLAVCLSVFAALGAYKVMQIRSAIAFAESFPEPSETVEVFIAESRMIQKSTTTIGEIIAPQSIDLRNELEGRIAAVNFTSGQTVKQGQVLLQLDISEETARLQAAQARADLAQVDLKRVRKLRQNKTVSEERFDQAKAEYDIANADIAALKAAIDKKTLRAPFDARVGIHEMESGEFLQSNTLITTLVGLNDYTWVDFNLPLHQANIPLGTSVEILTNARANESIQGEIIARDSVMSAQSRNLRFRAKIESDTQFQPNAIVNVRLPLNVNTETTVVPATAVRHDKLGDYVYILQTDQQANGFRAIRRSVVTGFEDKDIIAITDGLNAGETIAANGTFKLRDNLLVFVKERPIVSQSH